MKFRVLDGQRLVQVDHDVVSTDTTDFSASFKLNNLFTGTVTSYWMIDKESDVYKSVLSSSGSCTAPWEVFAARGNGRSDEVDHVVYVSLADAGRTTSSRCEIRVFKSAYAAESTSSGQVPSDAYQDLVDMINEGQLKGDKGDAFTLQDFMGTDTYESIIKVTEDADSAAANAAEKANMADLAAQAANAAATIITGEIQRLDTDITKNTEHDKTMNRRVDALFKLGEGVTHQFEEDAAAAYEKTVPTGAKLASVKAIGGKTVVMNQLAKLSGSNEFVQFGITYTKSENGFLLNGTSSSNNGAYITEGGNKSISLIPGHKVLARGLREEGSTDTFRLVLFLFDGTSYIKNYIYSTSGDIFTVPENYEYASIYPLIKEGYTVENIFITAQLFDLTQMFGAGNEPATVEEFKAMFPDDYYPYNAGELLSAPVSEVVEQGGNLINTTLESKTDHGVTVTNNGDGTYTLNGKATDDSFFLLYDGENRFKGCKMVGNTTQDGGSVLYATDTRYYDSDTGNGVIISIDSKNIKIYIKAFKDYTFNNTLIKPMVTTDLNATYEDFVPYHQNTYPIPQAILDLPGYGWSAGDVYNYVDLENKKYHKRVGSVDLGTLNWAIYSSSSGYISFCATLNCVVKTPLICDKLSVETQAYGNEKTNIISNHATYPYIYARLNDSYTDAEAFKAAVSGFMLYYQLETEEIIDISDLLPEDFLASMEVEPGGTLTFKNSNGDGYRIPVPNTEEYIVKLSELGGETA